MGEVAKDVRKWISPDPMREFFSPYNYVGNNPVNAIDPDGLDSWKIGITATTSGAGGGGGVSLGLVFDSDALGRGDWGNFLFASGEVFGGLKAGLGASGRVSFGYSENDPSTSLETSMVFQGTAPVAPLVVVGVENTVQTWNDADGKGLQNSNDWSASAGGGVELSGGVVVKETATLNIVDFIGTLFGNAEN